MSIAALSSPGSDQKPRFLTEAHARQLGWPEPPSDRTIRLHGALAARHGAAHARAVSSPSEAVRALIYTLDGFDESLRDGDFQIFLNDEFEVGEEDLKMNLGTLTRTIDIYPVVGGHKKGLGKMLAGVLLIGLVVATGGLAAPGVAGGAAAGIFGTAGSGMAGFWGLSLGIGTATIGSAAASIGLGLLLNGVTAALAPTPQVDSIAEDRPSYLFNSTTNVTQEGNVIPIMLGGPGFAASAVISSDLETLMQDLSNEAITSTSEVTWGGYGGFSGYQ